MLFVLHVVAPADAVSLDAASADAIQLRRVVFPELLAKLDVRSRNLEQVATHLQRQQKNSGRTAESRTTTVDTRAGAGDRGHLPCDDAAPLSRVLEDTPLLVGLLERPLTDSELACHGL